MKNFMKWMTEKFGPAITKITDNAAIGSITDGMLSAIPLILVGTFAMITVTLKPYLPFLPDLTTIQNYSFGLFGLFVAFSIPYKYMERKNCHESKVAAGLITVGVYFMTVNASYNDAGMMVLDFSRFSASGIFAAVILGLFSGMVMSFFEKKQFFSKGGLLPQFVTNWIDVMVSAFIVYIPIWILTVSLKIDVYAVIANFFAPLEVLGQSYAGFVLIMGISVFLYAFGLSAWTLAGIMYAIWLPGIAENSQLVAQGLQAVNINTFEVIMAWLCLGGMGCTLMLNILFLSSKSKRLKGFGKATLLPSIMNINEPMVFGAPIAWNPILMIPFIINGFLVPAIVYPIFKLGLVAIPAQPNQLWFLPIGVSAFMLNQDWKGVILVIILLVVTGLVWYPFFKVYEKQCVEKERLQEEEEKHSTENEKAA